MSSHSSRIVWIALGLLLGAFLIYLGVSATAPDSSQSSSQPAHAPPALTFAPWEPATWSEASARSSLVFLLVSDSLLPQALALESWLENDASLRSVLASQFLPVRVDRRHRPDLAERYAAGQVPHLSVLLPTGEALARVTGDPGGWNEQLVETARYYRDHQAELRDRAEDFWMSQVQDTLPPAVARPQASDISIIDSAVFDLVATLVAGEGGPVLWRTDLDRYLAARKSERALSLWQALREARAQRRSELSSPATLAATPAQWLRTVLELHRYAALFRADSSLRAIAQEWARGGDPVTAEETALGLRLALAMQQPVRPDYPGSWLGFDVTAGASLPHLARNPGRLDGYFADALAWLELLLEADDAALLPHAVSLADSLWARLWDPVKLALRDKPLAPEGQREIRVYPRAQLGRAATLLLELARRSGDARFSHRADSCLSGFAPYVREAGAAATYYGEAVLQRAGASGEATATAPDR